MTSIGTLFDDGAEHFERLAPPLWNVMGNAVAAAADLHVGERVFDACCGSGASTIPAAQIVGPAGHVDAVDLSKELLGLAAAKASALGIGSVSFSEADVMGWTAELPYDALLCCYGLFFLPDMAAGVRHFGELLRPGGRLAMSTWQSGSHELFASLLKDAALAGQPHLADMPEPKPVQQAAAIATPSKLQDYLLAQGFSSVEVREAPLQIPLDRDLAWSLVLGSGYRHLLPVDERERAGVQEQFLDSLGDSFTLNADTLIAVATR